ncbi:c6 zinc finger domain containing protein [Grosmannia clavigera kw1407]|uniref:C6 zinc finger domain containing protein n=1 Tax=Grosmannia clavigera (strain kw1407 / UAMH 11150) TaxID=655863 RepID=F0XSP0_GROCL|nr:c6 zinc finger domain containing protein [Grosmannia clavigera kw1407]EFW99311.1 c6 zinc finger domain containing protein [Grosmannia clavigera kw1407]
MGASGLSQEQSDASAPGFFQVISLGDASSSAQQTRDYKRRRTHKKSRGGCSACKLKRVKCDQALPTCLRCRRNQRECVYEHPKTGPDGEPAGSVVGQTSTALVQRPLQASRPERGTTTMTMTKAVRLDAISATSRPNFRTLCDQPFPDSDQELGTSSAALLHHFETVGRIAVFDMPDFVRSILPLAVRHSHLRGTVISVAASHLCHWAPGSRENRIALLYQQNMAMQAYRQALSMPLAEQGQAAIDALLITAMIINMLAFIVPTDESDVVMEWHGASKNGHQGWLGRSPSANLDIDPRRSWVFSTQPNRLVWLAVAMGLAPLIEATAPWRTNSSLRDLFANSDDERRILSGTWQSVHRVPQAWLDLFGIDRRIKRPLRVLAELWTLPANGRTVLLYFQFLSQLTPEIRHLLFVRDHKTLWLFGMWMGLLCRLVDVWWVPRRARCDFRAIRLWLDLAGVHRRPGPDGPLWRQLLHDLDRTWQYDFAGDTMVQQMRYSFQHMPSV